MEDHPFKCVEVLWEDACSSGEGWTRARDLPTPQNMTTRGWLAKEEPGYVVMAGTYYGDDMFGEVICIPRCCIQSIMELECRKKELLSA